MLLNRVITVALTLFHVSKAANITWGPCSNLPKIPDEYTRVIECRIYKAPLCHPGICETPKSANKNIDVFVKRFRPLEIDPDSAPNLWLLQGGVSYNPGALDWAMIGVHMLLVGKVNVYTMDHRGTGQSIRLTCEAADSSSNPNDMDDSLVPECAQEVEEKYGDLAAFSTTSAATDLLTFIVEYGNGFSTTVYGVGDGARWVERVMHLDPPEVTGYVLDSIASTLGVPLNQFLNASSMGGLFSEVAETVLDLCDEDPVCGSRFKKKGLKATLKQLIVKLDKNPNSKCAEELKTAKTNQDGDPPSFVLRYTKNEEAPMMSAVLDNLILGSENWESPTPSVSEMKQRFEATSLDMWASYSLRINEKSPACDELKLGNYKGNGIVYERDKYWNKAVKFPDQTSVMIMSSESDPNSPSQYSEYQLDALEGEKKKLFTFKYTTGGNVVDQDMLPLCGMKLLATFVQEEGDFSKMNTTCFEKDAHIQLDHPNRIRL